MYSPRILQKGKFSQPNDNGHTCNYGFFSCSGGASVGKYASLNVGLHVGDEEFAVYANRKIIKTKMGAATLLSARQIHGTKIHIQGETLTQDLEVSGCDALITARKGVALMVQHADCQAVLLYDSVAGVIAAVHNGWRGSVQNILAEVVAVMVRDYLSRPENIQAAVGPSLGPCCAEFRNYKSELPGEFSRFMTRKNYFDFWEISREQLMEEGVQAKHIIITGQCTRCSTEYFSYRKAVQTGDGVTGRNGSVIVLSEV